ncbi:AT-hook motif nuclear-localized protein 17-like [Phragmites australis]|uniref:AT-hook motif nuclear-localized protein 17-like n=1 Tax=Phragmites australis TaxID=29695 RepID=UPI002D78CD69|nr:AT-hook motif nuclear-localized protein 17-like [Phragmites australis]
MSFGKRDMSQENLHQDRKDVTPIHFRTPTPPLQQPQHGGHGEHQHQQLECFSDEVDSRASAELKDPASAGTLVVSSGGDGASIEVAKKRRGRPPGSKNKPKPPVVITREAEPAAAMRPHVIEIPCGRDVADALARFATRRNLGICVLAGTGAVANVSLRHPTPGVLCATPAAVVFHGQYEILSISATFLPPAMSAVAPQAAGGVSISLAGPHGQIIGGTVTGPLYAATTVVVVAAAFTNPTFHRLPADDDASVSVSVSFSAGSGDAADEHRGHQQHQPEPPQEQRHVVQRQPAPHLAASASVAQPCGPVPIFACYPPPPQEVMWPPVARAPHPPPPPY